MFGALAFFIFGLVFVAVTLGWALKPHFEKPADSYMFSTLVGLVAGVLLAILHWVVDFQYSFMLQFGIPAVLSMFLFELILRHEPGKPKSKRNWAFILVMVSVVALLLEMVELISFQTILAAMVPLLGLAKIALEFLEPSGNGKGEKKKSKKAKVDSEADTVDAAETTEEEATKAETEVVATAGNVEINRPRGLPEGSGWSKSLAWILGCLEGIAMWRHGPVLSWGFADLALLFFDIAVLGAVLLLIINAIGNRRGGYRSILPTRAGFYLLLGSFLFAILIPAFVSSPMFFWRSQAAVLGDTIKFASQAELLEVIKRSNEGKPRLPWEVADNIAHQRLGGAVGPDGGGSLGKNSQVVHYTMQTLSARFTARSSDGKDYTLTYNHEPVWLVPLEPVSMWRQLMRGHTDGFVVVNANSLDANNGHLVTHINGKPLEIHYYCNGGYFSKNVKTYLYRSGYRYYGLTEGRFVLNPEGRPYCAVTGYRHATGFQTPIPVALLLVDVQTGEIQEFEAGKQPEWIDQLFTEEMWETHLNNWGSYRVVGTYFGGWLKSGWLHSVLDGTGVMHSSGETTRTEVDGRTLFFTSMTDGRSVTGYAIGNALTRETTIYQMPNGGITEYRAREQVISNDPAISNLRKQEGEGTDKFHISKPMPMSVDDALVFQMVATNANGAPFRYAFVGIDANGITAVGATFNDARASLRNKLEEMLYASAEPVKLVGTLKKLVVVQTPRGSEFWAYLAEFPGTAFAVPVDAATWLPVVAPGEKLSVVTKGKPRPDRRINVSDITRQ